MIANGILVFRITINPADLQYPLIILFAGVKLELSSKIQSAFRYKTATINPVAIAKIFHIIYDAIFMFLLNASQTERGLLRPISNYFDIVEMNNCGILYLHCLVWLKGMLDLATLQTQLQSNNEFRQKLLLFLKYIIKYSASQNLHFQILDQSCLNTNNLLTIPQFANLMRSDSEAIAHKFQMYLLSHKPIYYKYNIHKSKVGSFDFLQLSLSNSMIDINRTIWL